MHQNGVEPEGEHTRQVLNAFSTLTPHPDVRPALERIKSEGLRAVTLSNGSRTSTESIIRKSGLENLVEKVICIEDVGHWKPRAEVYRYAADMCGVRPGKMALVAAHAWDIQGAGRAGLVTGWVSRKKQSYATAFDSPDVTGADLVEVINSLLSI